MQIFSIGCSSLYTKCRSTAKSKPSLLMAPIVIDHQGQYSFSVECCDILVGGTLNGFRCFPRPSKCHMTHRA